MPPALPVHSYWDEPGSVAAYFLWAPVSEQVPVVVALLVCIAEPPPSDGPGAPGPPLGVHRALDTGRRTPF